MACRSSHRAGGGGGGLHHGAAELLLFHPVCCELEGPEEEDGPLPDIVEKEKGLHAPDKVCAGQRKHLRVEGCLLKMTWYLLHSCVFKNK